MPVIDTSVALGAALLALLIAPTANAQTAGAGQALSTVTRKFTSCGQACFAPSGLTFKTSFADEEAVAFCNKWQSNAANAVRDCCFNCAFDSPDFGNAVDLTSTCSFISSGMLPPAGGSSSSPSSADFTLDLPFLASPDSTTLSSRTSARSTSSKFTLAKTTLPPTSSRYGSSTRTGVPPDIFPFKDLARDNRTIFGLSVPLFAIIIFGAAAGLIVIIAIAICCSRRRNALRYSDPETSTSNMRAVPPSPATMTTEQIKAALNAVATPLSTFEQVVQKTKLNRPGVFFFFDLDCMTDVWAKFVTLAKNTSYKEQFNFFTVECTAPAMTPTRRQQITGHFSLGHIPSTLIFKNGAEVERANGSSSVEFSQVEDHIRRHVEGSAAAHVDSVVQLLSKPSAYEETAISEKFMKSLAHVYQNAGLKFEIIKIEVVRNRRLETAFVAKQKQLKKSGRPDEAHFAFHATPSANVVSICTKNLDPEKRGNTDSGFFGEGFYFSTYADYCARYIYKGGHKGDLKKGDRGKIIMFEILPGKTYKLSNETGRSLGMKRQEGHDSHISPKKAEWVLFHPSQFLPRAVIEFKMIEVENNKFPNGFEDYVK
ncbi:Elongation factor 1-beta [Phlyctochytrium bullatum]|nr:Elongation factor 1-beta [Phlyctochytrium bullatum]